MTGKRLAGLDALRGIAAMCVVLFHLWPQQMANAYLAVDLFFMLSGYVMARNFEPAFAAGLTPGQFLRVRYLRLWPIMAIGGLLHLPIFLDQNGPALLPVAAVNLLLLPLPLRGLVFPLNGPSWSIFFELLANALHAAGLWRLSAARLGVMVAAMAAVLALVAALSQHSLEVGMRPEAFWAGVPRVLMSYCGGMLLWRLWRDSPPIAVPGWAGLALLPLYVGVNILQGGSRWPVDLMFVTIGGALAVAGALRMTAVPRWLVWLGSISFPLYAVHGAAAAAALALGLGKIMAIAAALAAASAVAAIEPGLRRAFAAYRPRAISL